jgi:hypothetical protein
MSTIKVNTFKTHELRGKLMECTRLCYGRKVRRTDVKMNCQASVPRDVFPPTPPGPEGSNGNGLLRVQWVAGAWLISLFHPAQQRAPLRDRSMCFRSGFWKVSPIGLRKLGCSSSPV